MTIHQMQVDIVRGRLRSNFQECVNTLIAADISERDALLITLDALAKMRADMIREFTEKHTRSAE